MARGAAARRPADRVPRGWRRRPELCRPRRCRGGGALARSRGQRGIGRAVAGAAVQALQASFNEDANLEVVIPVARALLAGGPPEAQQFVMGYSRFLLARIAQGTLDEKMRVRWLRGPLGRELVALVGSFDERAADGIGSDAAGSTA